MGSVIFMTRRATPTRALLLAAALLVPLLAACGSSDSGSSSSSDGGSDATSVQKMTVYEATVNGKTLRITQDGRVLENHNSLDSDHHGLNRE